MFPHISLDHVNPADLLGLADGRSVRSPSSCQHSPQAPRVGAQDTESPRVSLSNTLNFLSSLGSCWIVWNFKINQTFKLLDNFEAIPIDASFTLFWRLRQRAYCMESWDVQYGRLLYSIFILLLQLILPSLILILAHASIYRKLVSSRFLLRRSSDKEFQTDIWCQLKLNKLISSVSN